ncbi:MAG: minor capsid protein [Candidatus Methanospirareceae archaeon]
MTDITRTAVLRHEFERSLRRLPGKAAKRIKKLLETGLIGDETIAEVQRIITQELGAKEARKVLNRYSMLFWKRGSEFALRQLKRAGLTLEIPSYLAVMDEETLNALRALSLDLVKGMSDSMKKDVAFQMREGMLRGEHPTKIADRIAKVTRITKNRATKIARTEATRVFNEAAGDRYKKAGIERFRWDTIGDERTCDICNDLNGKIFKMAAMKPPAHSNCRCTITPVIEKS